jgi:excisionase family DNA binding protein
VAEYLKIPEVARRLDVSEKTARRYIKSGALPSTFIGGAYRVTEKDLDEFVHRAEVRPEDASPKAPRHSPSEPTLLNGLLEDERLARWRAAVTNARRLRESGRVQMDELLAAWSASKERQEDAGERRGYLDEIGQLLQQAYDAETRLLETSAKYLRLDEWEEIQAADGLYRDLVEAVLKHKLFVVRAKTSDLRPTRVDELAA